MERQMFCWIQILKTEAEQLQVLGKVASGSGYECTDMNLLVNKWWSIMLTPLRNLCKEKTMKVSFAVI
jgi:hypothetical protein